MTNRSPKFLRVAALPAVLLSVLLAAAVAYTPADWSGEWDTETSSLISNSVYRKVTRGWLAPLGYPGKRDDHQSDIWHSDSTENNYYHQLGLSVYLLTAVAPRNTESLNRMLLASRYVADVLDAVIVAAS